jgi:hypothetical protein
MDKFLIGGKQGQNSTGKHRIASATVVRHTKPDEGPATKQPAAGIGLDTHF